MTRPRSVKGLPHDLSKEMTLTEWECEQRMAAAHRATIERIREHLSEKLPYPRAVWMAILDEESAPPVKEKVGGMGHVR